MEISVQSNALLKGSGRAWKAHEVSASFAGPDLSAARLQLGHQSKIGKRTDQNKKIQSEIKLYATQSNSANPLQLTDTHYPNSLSKLIEVVNRRSEKNKMSLLLRDPFLRELLVDDYERGRRLQPYHYHRHPIRVHRYTDDWPLSPSFDHALSDLQNMMENVNEAIGQYQNSVLKDVGTGGMKTTRTEDGNLQLAVDVSQYKPEEINVKLCDDNLVIEAKTESSENDSYHKSEFKRWIKLPQDVKHDSIRSTLTADKKLLVEVPVNKPIADSRSRSIPITVQKEAIENKKGQSGDQQQNHNNQQQQQAKK